MNPAGAPSRFCGRRCGVIVANLHLERLLAITETAPGSVCDELDTEEDVKLEAEVLEVKARLKTLEKLAKSHAAAVERARTTKLSVSPHTPWKSTIIER